MNGIESSQITTDSRATIKCINNLIAVEYDEAKKSSSGLSIDKIKCRTTAKRFYGQSQCQIGRTTKTTRNYSKAYLKQKTQRNDMKYDMRAKVYKKIETI